MARGKIIGMIKNQFFHARKTKEFLNPFTQALKFHNLFTELLMAASIPGVQIFNWKSGCVMFFNMQNSNFRVAPESERTGLVLM